MESFTDELLKYHREILNGNIYDNWNLQENLASLIEGMTNINDDTKFEIFNELCMSNSNYSRIIKLATTAKILS